MTREYDDCGTKRDEQFYAIAEQPGDDDLGTVPKENLIGLEYGGVVARASSTGTEPPTALIEDRYRLIPPDVDSERGFLAKSLPRGDRD